MADPPNTAPGIAGHYGGGGLLARLEAALDEDGADPKRPTADQLAPYDQFHGRGIEATEELAALLPVRAGDRLLDVGSGIGGPARYLARRFGCRVSGIDLTAEFCAVARELTRRLGLQGRVEFVLGDALAMPFAAESFDGACSMNVAMNIADKRGFYREIRRVLKPSGWFALSEVARGPGPAPEYPTPWARSAAESFLAAPEATRAALEREGFKVEAFRETLEQALAYARRSRAAAERGEKPPHRAVTLIHGPRARAMIANTARALNEGSLVPIEVLCRKA
jgi:ubiquinone/menaquinone biosynthesis C-methylase UbiE